MPEEFTYKPLTGREIRLLSIKSLASPSDDDTVPISMTLTHRDPHQKIISAPFWALSYVWGRVENPRAVHINGMPFQVTSNLYEALVQYRRRFLNSETRPAEAGVGVIWIDAICINQKDNLEKSVQVPRMKEIYGLCERVLAWLGPVTGEEDGDIALMAEILHRFDDEVKDTGVEYSDVIEAFREKNRPNRH